MTIFTKILALIAVLGVPSLALAQSASDKEVADNLAKLSARLKLFDTNDNGTIDAEEGARPGAAMYLDQKVWQKAGVEAQYPIAISGVLKVAETAYRGGKMPAAATPAPPQPAVGATQPAAAPQSAFGSPTPSATSPGPQPHGTLSPSVSGSAAKPSLGTGSLGGPASGDTASTGMVATAPVPVSKPALTKYRFATGKERNNLKGLPDWFLAKQDADGQIPMADFTDRWTSNAVSEFEKYDLNHDGIITADECLKVLNKRGGK